MNGGSGETGIPPIQDEWNKTGSHDPHESKSAGDPEPQQGEDEEVDYDYYGYAWSYLDEQAGECPGKEPEEDDSSGATCGAGEEEDEEGRCTLRRGEEADDDEEEAEHPRNRAARRKVS